MLIKITFPQYDINALLMYDNLPIDMWHESQKEDKKYVCSVCNHRSKRRHNMLEHMLTHDPNRPKLFSCSLCHRPFARKYDMKRHEKIHYKQ
ncbi:unnamed protein product [Rhizopus stolonifer]